MSSSPAPSNRAAGAPRLPWRRWPRLAVAIEIVVVALLGCWLGVVVGGSVDASVGPVETRMSISPSWTGDSVVAVPPLGRLSLDSHDGPLRLDAQVTRINTADARRIFNNPASVRGLPEAVAADVRSGLGPHACHHRQRCHQQRIGRQNKVLVISLGHFQGDRAAKRQAVGGPTRNDVRRHIDGRQHNGAVEPAIRIASRKEIVSHDSNHGRAWH